MLAAMAAASLASLEGIPECDPPAPRPPKTGYQPGDFRWRNVKKSYSRTLAARLRKQQNREVHGK